MQLLKECTDYGKMSRESHEMEKANFRSVCSWILYLYNKFIEIIEKRLEGCASSYYL